MEKKCFKCGEVKNIDNFYIHSGTRDGYLNKCKECTKKDTKEYRQNNVDKCRERSKKWISKNRELSNKYKKNWKVRHPEYEWVPKTVYYETYASQLTIDDNPTLHNDGETLQVDCKYCGKTFVPEHQSVRSRTKAIRGQILGESNFYCSHGCKRSCPVYYKSKYPEGLGAARSREVQPQLRKLVFQRDNWTCQKCGSTEELHCHHTEGVEINPVESSDIDICVTFCKKCHNKIHKQKDCDMRRKKCKNGTNQGTI